MKNEYVLYFYNVDKPYGCFSNFSRHSITIDDISWPTVEHYFQAQKFHDPKVQEKIRQAKTPFVAAQLGRDRNNVLRKDWEVLSRIFRTFHCSLFNGHG